MARFWQRLAMVPVLVCGWMVLSQPVQADMVAPGEETQDLRIMPQKKAPDGDNSVPRQVPGYSRDDCVRGGCSGELCLDPDEGGMASACIWKPEFECYTTLGECKRQPSGKCGWTQSTALKNCISDKQQ